MELTELYFLKSLNTPERPVNIYLIGQLWCIKVKNEFAIAINFLASISKLPPMNSFKKTNEPIGKAAAHNNQIIRTYSKLSQSLQSNLSASFKTPYIRTLCSQEAS